MQIEFFRLEVLTPVHIGTGEEVDPMAYLMREEEAGPACHILDTQSWAAEYPEPEALCAKFSGGNVPQMRKFLADSIDPDIYGIRRIAVTHPDIYKEYVQKRDDQSTTNQLRLSPQMTSNGRAPIIPGSSLKGALRTAVIDWLDREQGLHLKASPTEYNRKLEQGLGRITESAFKELKIGDVAGWVDSTELVEALEIRRKEGKPSTPKSKCEALPGGALGDEAGATLYGRLSLGNAFNGSHRLTLPGGKSWDWPELCRLVNAYLLPRLDAELDKFYRQPHFAQARPVAQDIRSQLAEAAEGQMFLRVGHYSQVEFVTVQNNQPLTKRGKDGKQIPYGTTRTLANGLYPFGWVRITPCSEQEYQEGLARREEAERKALTDRLDRRQAIAEEKNRLQVERQERKRQVREAAEQEERRQAELEAMSPLDRQLYLLRDHELHEHQVVELFNSLEEMEEDDCQRAAAAIRNYWQSIGKWAKKDCSKKQWEKVRQLKAFLGES